ncbi:MAG: MerR family transcriptional regulator [Gemmatimonadota bacterium]
MDGMTVGELAERTGLTVRTLHHYDEIGLLVPSRRSASGYRLYDDADLARLQQILLFRELDFPLETIGQLLDDPSFDRRTALRSQRELLVERIRRTEAIIRAVDRTVESLEGERVMSATEMFEGFDATRYEEEARERWGETDAYKESMRRARDYDADDWARIKAEGEQVMEEMAKLLAAGHRPDDEAAMALAERHRLHIDRWFYPCSRAMHAGLAEMYTTDARFGEYFEKRAEGLAEYVAEAIRANAARAG